jgi:hypothetical protein
MHERILRDFLLGNATAAELAQDVQGSTKWTNDKTSITSVEDMDEDFRVSASMAIRLCDAVLTGDLPPDALSTIGFALMASDHFCWDGDEDEVLADVISDWACPEINYPLTLENVERFRNWLLRVEPYPTKPPVQRGGEIVSIREKKPKRGLFKRR